jgi:lipopolysaccharide/colanic/teichoic acid biosynthesis glycosyltransferase
MKRTFDLVMSAIGLFVLSPLFIAIGMLIVVYDGRPVFFRQVRVGHRGRLFRMWKFRTMVRDAEKLGNPLTVGDDPRVTRIGRLLRKSKLDELPQLLNVLVGEMSLVGPRPEVERYVRCYTDEQYRVLELVPGITDAASISYCNESELLGSMVDPEKMYIESIVPEKIRLNLEYAGRADVLSDCAIILRTVAGLCSGAR